MRHAIEYFKLPKDKNKLNELINEDLITITNKIVTPSQQTGTVTVYLEFEDYRNIEDESYGE